MTNKNTKNVKEFTKFYTYLEITETCNDGLINKAIDNAADKIDELGRYDDYYIEYIEENAINYIDESDLFEMKNGGRLFWDHYGRAYLHKEHLQDLRLKNDLEYLLPYENDLREKYEDLQDMTNYYIRYYLMDRDFTSKFILSFDLPYKKDLKDCLSFLKKYNQNAWKEYRFISIHNSETIESETRNEIESVTLETMKGLGDEIEDFINNEIDELIEKVEDLITEEIDYYSNSTEYVKNCLESDAWIVDDLVFNSDGYCFTKEEMEEIISDEENEYLDSLEEEEN